MMTMDLQFYYQKGVMPYLRDPQKKAYTLAGMTLIALIVFGAFAIRPALATIVSLRKEMADLIKIDAQLNTKMDNLALIQTQYKLAKNDLYLLDIALPDEPEIPEILNTVTTLAVKTNLSLSNLTIHNQKTESDNTVVTTSIETDYSGTYQDFLDFISLTETNLRKIHLTNINLTSRDYKQQEKLKGHLTFEIYSLQAAP